MKIPFLFSPDASGASPTPTPAPATLPKRAKGPFDKKKMAALDECEEVAQAAQTAPSAARLDTKYAISSASVATLLADISTCEGLYGSARTNTLGAQTSTDAKDDARENIIEAIDEFRTGARLSFKTEAEMRAFGVGEDLEKNEPVLAQLAQTILDNPASPTLRGIGAEEMGALKVALKSWKRASQSQRSGESSGQGDLSNANALFESIEARAREIKIAIDGKFSFRKPENVEARKLFHLPLKRPFAPRMDG